MYLKFEWDIANDLIQLSKLIWNIFFTFLLTTTIFIYTLWFVTWRLKILIENRSLLYNKRNNGTFFLKIIKIRRFK